MADPAADELARALASLPRERTWLLPALHAAQHAIGHLSPAALRQVAAHLRVPLSEVWGVATGYPELRLEPTGRHHVRVCTGASCALLGGRALLDEAARHHGAVVGETGVDKALTLEPADCFFACSMAPMIEVDGACRGRVTADDVRHLDRWFREGSGGPADGHHPSSGRTLPAAGPSARAAQGASGVGAFARMPRPGGDVAAEAAPMSPGATSGHAPPAIGEAPSAAADPATGSGAGAPAAAALDALLADAEARRRRRPAIDLAVQMGTCGRSVGADALLTALRAAVAARGLDARVVEGACSGMCYAAPSIEIRRAGWPRAVLERVAPDSVSALVDALAGDGPLPGTGLAWSNAPWRGLEPAWTHPFWSEQERVLLARAGAIDPREIDDALAHGAYRALARALDGGPEAVMETVRASGLLGRGGAFFPTASKWDACRKAEGAPKYVVVNGEEGEPGIFKDRHLMEGDPHQLIEGALIAAHAVGASHVILFVHGEANLSAERLARAIAQAEAVGIVGERMLGRDAACSIEIRRGAGGFVLGEETALLESIEGRRAQPRTRPPFPVEAGLYGRPTVINNVETMSAIPSIVDRGGAWFAGLGTGKLPGTKVFGLSGPIARPGVVELRSGATLATLVRTIGGGLTEDRRALGAVVGGPSGSIVPASLFDVAMEPRERVSPGTGGIVAVPEGAHVAEVVRALLAFNARESCGKCTPCREGTPRLVALLDDLAGDPETAAARVRGLAEAIQLASLCGLGQAAPLSIVRALDAFGDRLGARA